MRNKFPMWFVVTVALMSFAPQITAQSNATLTSTPIREFKVVASPIYVVLARLAREYEVPIGFEESSKEHTIRMDLTLTNVTVRDVLDAVVQRDPRYEWLVIDDVINVRPKNRHDNVLNVRLDRLDLDLGDRAAAYEQIISQPRMKLKMKKLGVSPLRMEFGSFAEIQTQANPIEINNVTLRRALNEIVKCTQAHFWIVARYGKNSEFLILDF